MSTAYHAQTDGQTERTNQVLEGFLLNFVTSDQGDWYQLLPLAKLGSNNSTTNLTDLHTSMRSTASIFRPNG